MVAIDRAAELPHERRIRFRIGVKLGDIIAERGDIFGDGVNIAARLEALAEPGGISVSAIVHDQVRDKLAYQFDDLGEQTVKNIARPIRIYGLSVVAGLPRMAAPVTPRPAGPRYPRQVVAAAALVGVLLIAYGVWWLWPSLVADHSPAVSGAAATCSAWLSSATATILANTVRVTRPIKPWLRTNTFPSRSPSAIGGSMIWVM